MTSSPRVTNCLIFDGFNESNHTILYKGPFIGTYAIDTASVSDLFKFVHGERVIFRKGPYHGRIVVVLGVYESSLWVHDEIEGGAFAVKNIKTFSELVDLHDPEVVEATRAVKIPIDMNGPLHFRYTLSGDSSVLEQKFGLVPNQSIFLKTLQRNAIIVGEFLNVVWVTFSDNPRTVIPLPGATNEAALIGLYGLAERDAQSGHTSPRSQTVTPARTPRGNNGAPIPPFAVDRASGKAKCVGAFGNTIEVEIRGAGLESFGVCHGQRLIGSKGAYTKKSCTVVGSRAGSLFVLFEEDKRVTCLRNARNAHDLVDMFGFNADVSGKQKLPNVLEGSALNSPRLKNLEPSSPSTGGKEPLPPGSPWGPATSGHSKPSPRSATAEPFACWTANGRLVFDASDSQLEKFGVKHGQTLLCCKGDYKDRGGDRGKEFHVVGVRLGMLWVVPEGSSRATALRHCGDKHDLQDRYQFQIVGTKNMQEFIDASEPPKTPMPSPRVHTSPETTERVVSSSVPNPNPASPTPIVPKLNFETPLPVKHEPPPAAATSVDVGSSLAFPVTPSFDVSLSKSFPAANGSITRNYLKAYALLMMGGTSSCDAPFAFRDYFLENPSQRLSAAIGSMEPFLDYWRNYEQSPISEATVDQILGIMRRSCRRLFFKEKDI